MADDLTKRFNSGKKRKQNSKKNDGHRDKRRPTTSKGDPLEERISQLEEDLSKSPENKAKILGLAGLFNPQDSGSPQNLRIAVTMCKAFVRLMVASPSTIKEHVGLAKAYREYQRTLTHFLENGPSKVAPTWLELQIRLLKAEAEQLEANVWESDEISSLFRTIMKAEENSPAKELFVTKYLKVYHDYQLHFSRNIACVLIAKISES